MTQALPQGTLRHRLFEAADRSLGWLGFRQYRPLSNICGDQLTAATPAPCRFCSWMCRLLDKYVEKRHCELNAGKP